MPVRMCGIGGVGLDVVGVRISMEDEVECEVGGVCA